MSINAMYSGSGTNPAVPGNVASYNPPSGGNVAGYNTYTPGNVTGYNPSVTNSDWTADGGQFYSSYNSVSGWYEEYFMPVSYTGSGSMPSPLHQVYQGNSGSQGTSNYTSYDLSYASAGTYYSPGNANYNPDTPGGAYYNPSVPGNANYNASTPGYHI